MAPPLIDDYQIATAMRNEAVPALERLAENASLRDHELRRFDREEPPAYMSSTDDDYAEYEDVTALDEVSCILEKPLDDEELDRVAYDVEKYYRPGKRYEAEALLERGRLARSARQACDNTRKYFVQYGSAADGRAGQERVNIIIRRNIKRRWEKLGVWNSAWGIPGRANNPQPNDDTRAWKWPWQHGDAAAEWRDRYDGTMAQNPRHPVTRAVELRRGMYRSDHSPTIPRSRLGQDASASQSESFITSRPWFMFGMESSEDRQRRSRVSLRTWQLYCKSGHYLRVPRRWKERGDWKEDWSSKSRDRLIGWTWRHESPSPEPADHERLDDPTLDLTPSEIDALEAVRPPTPTPPSVYIPPTGPPHWLFGAPSPPKDNKPIEPLSPPVRWGRLCRIQQEAVEQPPPPRQTRRRRNLEEAIAQPTPPRQTRRRSNLEEAIAQPPPPRQTRRRSNLEEAIAQPPPPRQTRRRRNLEEPPPRQTRRRSNLEEAIAQPPPPRQTRQRRTQGLPSQPPLRRSPRVAARTAAVTGNQLSASSRVFKPNAPPRPRGRPRKKATQ